MSALSFQMLLEARGLEKAFGANRVLRGVDVQVPSGSVTCLIGPSGSGKTTVLRSLNGLEVPEAGTVRIGDVELDWAARPDPRGICSTRWRRPVRCWWVAVPQNRSITTKVIITVSRSSCSATGRRRPQRRTTRR